MGSQVGAVFEWIIILLFAFVMIGIIVYVYIEYRAKQKEEQLRTEMHYSSLATQYKAQKEALRKVAPPKWSVRPNGSRYKASFIRLEPNKEAVLYSGTLEFKPGTDTVIGTFDMEGQDTSIEFARNSANEFIGIHAMPIMENPSME